MFLIIEDLEKTYPLKEYESDIKSTIKTQLEAQYRDNNLVDRPKSLKSFQDLSLRQRLRLLNFEGAIELAEELCAQLQRIRALEKHKPKNPAKHWAQGQLRLRDVSEKTVTSLIEWAYYPSTLKFEDAEHLFDIWTLATRLEFDVLAQECMDLLVDTTSASITNAFSSNIGLGHLLGFSGGENTPGLSSLSNDFVDTVFRHVLRDKDPPHRLSDLVIQTLGVSLDSELWAQLQGLVSHDTAHRLIEILLAAKSVKSEPAFDNGSIVKCENQRNGSEAQINPAGTF